MSVCAVVPAAGRGSRLGADVPKILVPVDDGVTVWDLVRSRLTPHVDRLHVVLSPQGAEQFPSVGPPVSLSIQEQPIGMGDAIFSSWRHWSAYDSVLVVWGDQVHVSAATVAAVLEAHASMAGPRCTLPVVRPEDPYVEYRFAGRRLCEVRQSREGDHCTPGGMADVGVFCLSTAGLLHEWTTYAAISPTGAQSGELNFLPFLVHLSRAGWSVTPVEVDDPDEARGLNTPDDLVFAQDRLRRSRLEGLQGTGGSR